MALKLIGTLSVLILACFSFKVWEKTKVPAEVITQDVWKVRTIEFVLRICDKFMLLLSYLDADIFHFGRPIMSFAFDSMHYGIWPFHDTAAVKNDGVREYRQMMAGVPVILYRSESQINLQLEAMQNQEILTTPIIIYFHGGGWVWLDAEYCSPTLKMISKVLEIPAVSVDYRLSPEHAYPAALEDCLAVTNHIIENHKQLGVNPNKIIIAGDSAGGNLAAAVALKLKKKIKLQVLIYPVLQAFDFQTPSYRENNGLLKYILNANHVVSSVIHYGAIPHSIKPAMLENRHLTQETRMSSYSQYVHSNLLPARLNVTRLSTQPTSLQNINTDSPPDEDSLITENLLLDAYFMPLMAASLDGISDAYIVTAQYDILRDDGIFYASRLNNSTDVKVTLQHYKDAFHAFFHFSRGPLRLDSAERAIHQLIHFINANVM